MSRLPSEETLALQRADDGDPDEHVCVARSSHNVTGGPSYGERYHTPDCSYVSDPEHSRELSREEAKNAAYAPCKRCILSTGWETANLPHDDDGEEADR